VVHQCDAQRFARNRLPAVWTNQVDQPRTTTTAHATGFATTVFNDHRDIEARHRTVSVTSAFGTKNHNFLV
jgi:hypothetical protein